MFKWDTMKLPHTFSDDADGNRPFEEIEPIEDRGLRFCRGRQNMDILSLLKDRISCDGTHVFGLSNAKKMYSLSAPPSNQIPPKFEF
jgi:hypothetical protein